MLQTKHKVAVLGMNDRLLRLEIDGHILELPWDRLSARLARAPQTARETMEISPAGYGLHWPLVDEDLSINGILRDFGREGRKNV